MLLSQHAPVIRHNLKRDKAAHVSGLAASRWREGPGTKFSHASIPLRAFKPILPPVCKARMSWTRAGGGIYSRGG
jgi:hypothetical protein